MKIFEIIPNLSSGGAERFVVDLSNKLAETNEVTLVSFYDLRGSLAFYLQELSPKVKVISLHKKLGFDPSIIFRLFKLIKREKPDIVHTHLNSILYASISSVLLRPKFFHTIHNDALVESGNKITRYLRKLLFKTNKVIPITISDETSESFKKVYGYETQMIYNGRNIDLNQIHISDAVVDEFKNYRTSETSIVIVHIGRILNQKRQNVIARICKKLLDEGFDFTILFIGRRENEEIYNEILSLKDRRIRLLGEKNNILEYLILADGFCLLSAYEGMPISLIESLGTGTIPICTPVGGIKNVISNDSNGFLAENTSEKSCYNALKSFLLMNKEQRQEMQRNSLESFKPYSIESCSSNYIKLFNKTLNQ